MNTKIRDWNPELDGTFPVQSSRFRQLAQVLLSTPAGECAGWERPGGELIVGALLVPSSERQGLDQAFREAAESQAAKRTARSALLSELRAKREAGTRLTSDEIHQTLDLFLGVV